MNQQEVERIRKLAHLLDARFNVYGIRVGWDALIGLLPVLGDWVTTIISFSIVVRAWALGCGVGTLLRMTVNIGIEALVDMIPFFGNLFDVYWKANLKNVVLLDRHLEMPQKIERRSWGLLVLLGIMVLSVLGVASYLLLQILGSLVDLLTTLTS